MQKVKAVKKIYEYYMFGLMYGIDLGILIRDIYEAFYPNDDFSDWFKRFD